MNKPSASAENPVSAVLHGRYQMDFGLALLVYFTLVTLVITLVPFHFRWPSRLRFLWVGDGFDVVTNIFLFLPLGFLYRLSKPRRASGSFDVLLLGLLFSSGIELTQLCLPGRFASPADVLTNGFGAWLGAALQQRLQRNLNREWIGRLALQLPLMSIVYLLIPLVWIDGLTAGHDSSRRWLRILPGLCGATILSAVYIRRLKTANIVKPTTFSLLGAAWFTVCILPGAYRSPEFLLISSTLMAIWIRCSIQFSWFIPKEQRRFELPTLWRVFPLYVAFLLFVSLWPIPSVLGSWRYSVALVELENNASVVEVLKLVEQFAGFTLLGYMIAEAHGRNESSRSASFRRTFGWCVSTTVLIEAMRGFHPRHIASISEGILSLSAGLYGAILYWLQLVSIRSLVRGGEPNLPECPTGTNVSLDI